MRYIATLLPLLLGGYYVFVSEATARSRAIVAILFLISFAMLLVVPVYWLWALLLQIAVGLYIVFYFSRKRR